MTHDELGGPFLVNGRQLSGGALKLHVSATDYSVRRGVAGFIPDAYLDTIDDNDATLAVLDLCLNGLWERVHGGYLVLDQDYLDQMVGILAFSARQARRRWHRRSG